MSGLFDVSDGSIHPSPRTTTSEGTPSGTPRPTTDPARPGSGPQGYSLPDPVTGVRKTWPRVTSFAGLTDDTYHLELWKQRNVAKGIGLMASKDSRIVASLASSDVKKDKSFLNDVAYRAQETAGAWKSADLGTDLHKATELADEDHGDLVRVPAEHRASVMSYRNALAANGLRVIPAMIERVVVVRGYGVAGKFDRVYQLGDGSFVIGDLKTSASDLSLSMPSIAAQLACYAMGINGHGVFDGSGYDCGIRVRDDFGIVIHLPSTGGPVKVIRVDLNLGRSINEVNLAVRNIRKVKAPALSEVFDPSEFDTQDARDARWVELLNAANTFDDLVRVAADARSVGQWNERLSVLAQQAAAELG